MNSVRKSKEAGELGVARPTGNEADNHGIKRMMSVVIAIFYFCFFLRLGIRIEQAVKFVFAADGNRESARDNNDTLVTFTVVAIHPAKAKADDGLCEFGNPSRFRQR